MVRIADLSSIMLAYINSLYRGLLNHMDDMFIMHSNM